MVTKKPRPHDKWELWPDEDIQKYLNKHRYPTAPGKFSSHRRKKLKFLLDVQRKRENAMRLIGGL